MGLPERIRAYLTELARRRGTITYRDLAKALEVQPPNTIHQVADALEVLMQEDRANGAPFLAAMVVSKVRNGLPAPAFFLLPVRLADLGDRIRARKPRPIMPGNSRALGTTGAA